jgi:uncharacterized protein (DUF58 family)
MAMRPSSAGGLAFAVATAATALPNLASWGKVSGLAPALAMIMAVIPAFDPTIDFDRKVL